MLVEDKFHKQKVIKIILILKSIWFGFIFSFILTKLLSTLVFLPLESWGLSSIYKTFGSNTTAYFIQILFFILWFSIAGMKLRKGIKEIDGLNSINNLSHNKNLKNVFLTRIANFFFIGSSILFVLTFFILQSSCSTRGLSGDLSSVNAQLYEINPFCGVLSSFYTMFFIFLMYAFLPIILYSTIWLLAVIINNSVIKIIFIFPAFIIFHFLLYFIFLINPLFGILIGLGFFVIAYVFFASYIQIAGKYLLENGKIPFIKKIIIYFIILNGGLLYLNSFNLFFLLLIILSVVVFFWLKSLLLLGDSKENIHSNNAQSLDVLSGFNVDGIEGVHFVENDGKSYTIRTDFIKKLSLYIHYKTGKTIFSPRELDGVKNLILRNYKSKLPEETYALIVNTLSNWVENGGSFEILYKGSES